MMRNLIAILTIAVVSTASVFAIDLDEVIAKATAARGGEKAIKAISTVVKEGTMSMAQGMELNFTETTKRPSKFRMDMSFQGMAITQAFDGTTAWAVNPMAGGKPEKAGSEEVKKMAEQADMDGELIDWKKKGYKLELVGSEDIDGSTAYKIKSTKDDETSFLYIDAVTWLLAKIDKKMSMMGQEAEVEMVFSNYQDVNGVQMPMLMEIRSDGQTMMSMSYSSVKANVEVPDARFAFPSEDVKKN
jgi:outer membrane lipoprotein-sorting protein